MGPQRRNAARPNCRWTARHGFVGASPNGPRIDAGKDQKDRETKEAVKEQHLELRSEGTKSNPIVVEEVRSGSVDATGRSSGRLGGNVEHGEQNASAVDATTPCQSNVRLEMPLVFDARERASSVLNVSPKLYQRRQPEYRLLGPTGHESSRFFADCHSPT